MLSCKLPRQLVQASPLRPQYCAQTRRASVARRQPVCSVLNRVPPSLAAAPSPADKDVVGQPARLFQLARLGAAVGVAFALTVGGCAPANAANTGGRVGGSGFESRRQSSSADSRSLSTGGTTVHHTSVTVVQTTPTFGFGWGMPAFYMPFGGFGYGHSSASPMIAILMILLLMVLIFMAFQMFSNMNRQPEEEIYVEEEPPVTVMKLQVALLANARELRRDLDLLAARADTNNASGLHSILQEAVLSLMRNPQYCVYGTGSASVFTDGESAENSFNRLALEERSKFRQETLSNVGGISRQTSVLTPTSGVNELVVMTLVVAAEGTLDMPKITSGADLKTALTKLGGVPASSLVGLELMWTPQAEGDVFTRDQLIMDYPTLVPL